ncbi:hypothetical protein L916_02606, partial [Phytophthora nicotianae]
SLPSTSFYSRYLQSMQAEVASEDETGSECGGTEDESGNEDK